MKMISYLSIIFLCFLFVFTIGCERAQPPVTPSENQRRAINEQIINSYVEETKREVDAKPIEINIIAEINEIEKSPEDEHDLRFSILGQKLIITGQIGEAAKVVSKINDVVMRDTCYAKLARYQIGAIKNLTVNNTPLSPSITSTTSATHETPQISSTSSTLEDIIFSVNDLPLMTELGIEFAAVRINLSDKSGASDMLFKIPDKIQDGNKSGGIRSIKSLQKLVNWFLEHDQKDRALATCKKAEAAAAHISDPFDAAISILDISATYVLLDAISDASRVCETSIPFAAKVTIPSERATAILKIAETFSMLQIKFGLRNDVAKLTRLKKLILAVDPIIASYDLTDAEVNKVNDVNSDNANKTDKTRTDKKNPDGAPPILSWERIRTTRDMLLLNLVRRQIWLTPEGKISLDEVWSTIHDIDDDLIRDDAIITAVDMLCITGSYDEAKGWTDFIKNVDKKNNTIKKIETKIEAAKNQNEEIIENK
ncbi:MAG: hypothetical protein LBP59_15715 [Planctomycetaceae bacterium]|nr:hypothetical protein [Planctomycetaceae bacterium]